MPIAEDPEGPSGGPQDDPFAGLVLNEEFVRAATVKEPSGRGRMLGPVGDGLRSGPRRSRTPGRSGAGPGPRRATLLIGLYVCCGLAVLGLTLGSSDESPAPQPVRSSPAGTGTPSGPWPATPALTWPDGRMK